MGWEQGHGGPPRRGYRNQARGEQHGAAKLTAAQVRDIRASGEPAQVLAAEFGVHLSTVYRVLGRDTWGWLE